MKGPRLFPPFGQVPTVTKLTQIDCVRSLSESCRSADVITRPRSGNIVSTRHLGFQMRKSCGFACGRVGEAMRGSRRRSLGVGGSGVIGRVRGRAQAAGKKGKQEILI